MKIVKTHPHRHSTTSNLPPIRLLFPGAGLGDACNTRAEINRDCPTVSRQTALRLLRMVTFALCLITGLDAASAQITPVPIGVWPEYPTTWYLHHFAVQDDHVYTTADYGLGVLKIDSNGRLEWVKAIRGQDGPTSEDRVAVAENRLVVSVNHAANPQLIVFSIEDPDNPVERARLTLSGFILDCEHCGGFAYLLVENTGLVIVDISDPSQPIQVGQLANDFEDNAAPMIVVDGNHIYLASRMGGDGDRGALIVIDISDPANPTKISTNDLDVIPISMALMGNLLLMGTVDDAPSTPVDSLIVMDVADPAHPVEITRYLGLKGFISSIAVSGYYAYVASARLMQVLDLTDPTAPQIAGTIGRIGWGWDAIQLSGNHAFILDPAFGLRAIDVSNASTLREVGDLPLVLDNDGPLRISISGGYAYAKAHSQCSDWRGPLVFDVSNPSTPRFVWDLQGPGCSSGDPVMRASGDQVFVIRADTFVTADDGNMYPHMLFEVYAYGESGEPNRVWTYDAFHLDTYPTMDVSGKHVYLREDYFATPTPAPLKHALHVIDANDPDEPELIAVYDDEWLSTHFSSDGLPDSPDFLFEDDANGKCLVIDNTVPDHPRNLGPYAGLVRGHGSPESRTGVESGKLFYRYEDPQDGTWPVGRGLLVYDISDPSTPRLIGAYADTWPNGFPVSERFRYEWDATEGWMVSDVSDPARPQALGSYSLLTSVIGGATIVSKDYACSGDQLFDLSDPTNPTPLVTFDGVIEVVPLGNQFYLGTTWQEPTVGFRTFEVPPFMKSITERDGMVHLSWEGWGQARLQRSTTLTNPDWQDLIGSENVNEITLPRWSGSEFFRLVKP